MSDKIVSLQSNCQNLLIICQNNSLLTPLLLSMPLVCDEVPSLWWQRSVATEDCISPQPVKSSYAIWTTFIQSGPSAQKYPVWSLSLVFCVLWPAAGLLIGRNEAATDWQDGYFILPDSFVSSLDTHTLVVSATKIFKLLLFIWH